MSKKLVLFSKSFLIIFVAIFFGFALSHKVYATNSSKIVAGTNVQQNYQLKVDSAGNAHVLLVDQTSAPWALNYVSCGDNKCIANNMPAILTSGVLVSDAGKATLDTGTIYSPSFYLESTDLAVISYLKFNGTNYDLKFVRCSDTYCSAVTPTTLGTTTCCGVDGSLSLAKGGDTWPKILYTNLALGTNTLNFMSCGDPNCTAKPINVIDSSATQAFTFPTFVINSVGNSNFPFVAYYRIGASNQLQIRSCSTLTCSAFANSLTFAGANSTVTKISLFLDNLNNPSFAYQFGNGSGGFQLSYVKCTTVTCTTSVGPTIPNINGSNWNNVQGSTGGILWFPTGGGNTNETSAYGVIGASGFRLECIDNCLTPATDKAASCNTACYLNNMGGSPSYVTGTVFSGQTRFVYLVPNSVVPANKDTRLLTCSNLTANGCNPTGETNISLFIDSNSNGTRDANEPLVTGLSLMAYNNTLDSLFSATTLKTCSGASCTPSTVFGPNSPTYAPHYSGNAITWQSSLIGLSIALPHPFVATGFDQSNTVIPFAGNISPFTFQTSSVTLDGASVELGITKGTAVTVTAWYDRNEDGIMNPMEFGFGVGYPGFDNTTTARVEANIGGTSLQPLNLWIFGTSYVGVKNVAAFANSNFKVTPYTGTCVSSGTNCWKVTKYYWSYAPTPPVTYPLSYLPAVFTNFNDPGTTTAINTSSCGASCTIYLGLDKVDFDVKANSQISGSADPSPSLITMTRNDTAIPRVTVGYTNGWPPGPTDSKVTLAVTGCSVVAASCTPASFSTDSASNPWSTNPVIYGTSAQLAGLTNWSATSNLTIRSHNMPDGDYILNFTGTISSPAGYPTFSRNGQIRVSIIDKPWTQTTNGDVGSIGDSGTNKSINMSITSPSGYTNSSYLRLTKFTSTNFSSAKSWLIDSYGAISDPVAVSSSYYDYFWQKFGQGKAQDAKVLDPSICSSPGTFSFTSWGFKSDVAASCVLTDATKFQAGGIDNGVFLFKGDVTWNVADPTSSLGGDKYHINLTGNPTVIFITGKLFINKPIMTTDNKKFIFIVKNDSNNDGILDSGDAVQVNPMGNDPDPVGSYQIMASIITDGSVNTFSWLNQRNEERYQKMRKLEQKVIEYQAKTGSYPLSGSVDTSNGCSVGPYSGPWFNDLNPTGGIWGGTGINHPCSATQGLRYLLGAGLGAGWPAAIPGYIGTDINSTTALGSICYNVTSPQVNTACLDPTNGAEIPGKISAVAAPKRFALRYVYSSPGAYDLFSSMEDDAGHDQYTTGPDPEFHMCGGDYNNTGSFLRSELGQYCYKHNISFSGSIIAQGGFSLGRYSRDDNNSTYQVTANCPSPGAASDHCPTPAEAFNFDPSVLYYFAKEGSNQKSLFGLQTPFVVDSRP